MTTHRTKLLVIGAGPAGYTAALYAARAALAPIVVRGLQPGGQLTITTEVENWPGDASVLGPDLMARMARQAEHAGGRLVDDVIQSVSLGRRPFLARGDGGATYLAETVVIATGAQARWLGLESEARFRGFGVSACATCDGPFFRGKRVAVVGGGNAAVEEALHLAHLAAEVVLIHRRDALRADRTNQARLFAERRIRVVWNAGIEAVLGTEAPRAVTGLRLRDLRDGAVSTLETDGLFVAIGHDPATALFRGQLEIDAEGYIVTAPDSTATSVSGVFAAGDVRDKVFRQAVTAAGTGCMAALEAERFLARAGHALPAPLALSA